MKQSGGGQQGRPSWSAVLNRSDPGSSRSPARPDFFWSVPELIFCMGRLIIDERCRTRLKGLAAASEIRSVRANRYGGKALTEAVVFGGIAAGQAI
jgi:hypothetical protein